MFRMLRRKWARAIALWMVFVFLMGILPSPAQMLPPTPDAVPGAPEPPDEAGAPDEAGVPAQAAPNGAAGSEKLISLNFRDAPLDQVLQFYSELTGRTLIKSPGISGTITLRGQTRLTESEALQAIEAVLAMNNVTVVPMGTKFLKVVQPTAARQEGMALMREVPEKGFPETDHLISQVLTLKYIELAEAQTIIASFIHGYGKIQPLERTNSLLITDTASNLQRILEVLEYVDQPTEAKVETRVYELKYSEAAKIASRLNELIAEAQTKEDKPRVATPVTPQIPTPPGVMRPMRAAAMERPQAEIEAALAERGIVQGKVKIVADDRTNILIVISRPSNFTFFDKIVAILDRPVEPDVIVRVLALEFAKAEEISSILNDFIGAAKSETKVTKPANAAEAPKEGVAVPAEARSQILQQYVESRAEERIRQVVGSEKAKIGELSPNTKILADKRTNSLLLMGTKRDLVAIEEIINNLDTMLGQVLIEAVILEVNLTKSLDYGVDWLQRSMTLYADGTAGPKGGVTTRDPLLSFGGGQRLHSSTYEDGSDISRKTALNAGALTYYTTIFDLNMDVVLRMAAGSGDARILSTPVILTTDNTEAKIVVGEERPVVTSTSTSTAGQQTSAYEYRNIGINLTVTPRINPQRFVVMEIAQTADNVGGFVTIDNNQVPIVTKREMKAQVAVPSRGTIVLGGLVSTDRQKTRTKVPILGDIPLLGMLFRDDSDTEARTELLVLLTPYVLTTPEEARAETERLHSATRLGQAKWYRGWSDSTMARPTSAQLSREKKALRDIERRQEQDDKALQSQQQAENAAGKPAPARKQVSPRVTVVVPSQLEGGFDVEQAPTDEEEPQVEPPAEETVVEDTKSAPAEPVSTEPATAEPAPAEPVAAELPAPEPEPVPDENVPVPP
jgi:general secretion pathway protein D